MKKIYMFIIAIMSIIIVNAQSSIVFKENFELPSLGDSVQSSSNPVGAIPWSITTNLSYSGLRADTAIVPNTGSLYLTTNTFSTLGYTKVFLKFAQICKLLIQDGGSLQFSTDGGTVWTTVSSSLYRGSGVMALNKFNENSYSNLWVPGDTVTKPTNLWWRAEMFDLSTIVANTASVKLRFVISDGGTVGGEGRYGWLIDDIQVIAANNELDPPVITFKTPILQDSVLNTGPFQIKAFITDASSISTANLVYSVNGGISNTIAMTNTSDSSYQAEIPSFTYNNVISYRIESADQYANQNISNTYSFIVKKAPLIVEIGSGTTNGTYSPIYVSSATSTYLYSYNASIYSKTEINKTGFIKSIAWNKSNTGGYSLNNASFKIYLKSVGTNSNAPTTFTDYSNTLNGSTLVYSNLAQNIPTVIGWDTYYFNVDSFFYDGTSDLMVFVEFYRPGNATGAINYYYTTTTNKAYTFAGPTVPPAYNYANYRPHVRFGLSVPEYQYDAGVSQIVEPQGSVLSSANTAVKVRIKNFGTAVLTKANVHYAVDGVYQGSSLWSGNLSQDMVSTDFQVGTTTFAVGPRTIKAWTSLPNDSIDAFKLNDTLNSSVYACQQILNGIYTVGNSSADYPTISAALNAVNNCGISGPVTFKIKTGTYNQQLIIPNILNTSSVNTITFESESGNANDVKFVFSSTGTTDNFVAKLDAAKYIILKNISFSATGTTYGRVIELANGASYNTIEGCKIEMPITTSSNYAGIYNGTSTFENYNTIKNNIILNGYYGVYIYGTSANKEKSYVIEGNNISGFGYYGLYLYYQDSITVNSNIISSPSGTTAYGIYAYYNDNGVYLKNKLNMTASTTNYCMYLYYNNTAGTGKSLVANNFISQSVSTGTVYGLYSSYSKNMSIYHNSVNITKGSTTGAYAFYGGYGAGIKVFNNIFSNTGGGYAYYVPTATSGIDSSDNNCLYTTGTNLAYWASAKPTLTDLQVASNLDQNTLNVNPLFVSVSDLHTSNFTLGNKGKTLAEVTEDIDGDNRATVPCIGADEFIVPQNEAGIVLINQPGSLISNLTQDIKVSIQNLGLSPLTSATIKCTVNGVLLPSYSYTGNIPQFGVDSVVIANHTFSSGYSQIKVWSEMPNNSPDIYNLNDTLYKSVYACTGAIVGTFTVGGPSADFINVDAAMSALQCGVSGPVIFNINPGTYTGNFNIQAITGASNTNTITFKSANNDSTSVILQYNATGTTDNYVVKFDNCGYITFKNLSIKALNANNANVITLNGNLNNITLEGNILEGTQTTNTDDNQVIIRCNTLNQINGFNIVSNRINYGRMGINFVSTTASVNVVIKYNQLFNQSARPMNLNRIESLDFGFNQLYSDASKTANGGSFLTNLTGLLKIYNNTFINLGGVRVMEGWTYGGTAAGQEALVYNNYFYGSPATSYIFDGGGAVNNIKFYHNTFVGNSTSRTVNFNNYYGANANITFKNNIMQSTGQLLYFTANPTGLFINNNNYYTTGSSWAYFWGTTATNLATVKTASAQEANAVSINPQFIAVTDPHINNYSLKGLATPVPEVLYDIDNQPRNTTTPDMGCDELMLFNTDATIVSYGQPTICSGNSDVVIKLKNLGSNPLTSVNINWSANGIDQNQFAFTGNLATFADTSIVIGTYNFIPQTSYNLIFWTSDPNNVVDGNMANDTLKMLNKYTGLAAGIYTLGDSTADFLSFNAAASYLNTYGVCGAVTFNVKPGTYTEQFVLNNIVGASSSSRITFKSINNDSSSVVLQYNFSTSGNNYVIQLNGTQFVTISGMTLKQSNPSSGRVINFTQRPSNIIIANNRIEMPINTAGTTAGVVTLSSDYGNDNKILNNFFLNGYNSIVMQGSATVLNERNLIKGNVMSGFHNYGIQATYSNSPVIDSNTLIASATNTGTRNGILASYSSDSLKITRNTIILSNSTNTNGLILENNNSTASNKGLIANNFISILNGTTNTYGIRLYPNVYHVNVANNSINVTGTSNTDTRGINPTAQCNNIEVYNNNVFSNKYPNFYEGTAVTKSDYNNFYSSTNLYGYNNGTTTLNYTSLPALVAAYQKDSNSISIDPGFVSITDLHSDNINLYAAGKSLSYITNDIDGQIRPIIPSIGADEFTVAANDASIKALFTMGNLNKQTGVPHNVVALIKNSGSNTLTNVNVGLDISGSNTFTNTKTITSIVSGATDTITFDAFIPINDGNNLVKVSLPSDDIVINNESTYNQNVTDTVYGYADNSTPVSNFGFNTAAGLVLTKYYVNGSRLIKSVRAYISKDNTIGKRIYGVVLNNNGLILDTTYSKILTASDTNTWVSLNFSNPTLTTVVNNYFYVGIAQTANTVAYNPIACQKEIPARRGAYYFSNSLLGTNITETTSKGRFMIEAITMLPPAYDAGIVDLVNPVSGCGLTNAEQVKVKVANLGINTIYGNQQSLSVSYGLKVNGIITNIVTQSVSDTIPNAGFKVITFNNTVNVKALTADSTYKFVAWTNMTNDAFQINDTINRNVLSKYTPNAPIVNSISIPYATAGTFNAVTNDTVYWYANLTDTIPIAKGSSFTTPVLYSSETYYANANTSYDLNVNIGTGSIVNTTTGYPNPYGRFYTGNREQYLIPASELISQGIIAGPITSLGFNVTTPGAASTSGTAPSSTYNKNYTVKIGTTNAAAMTSTFFTGLTQVYTNPMYQEVNGWNMHPFSSPFIWDGTSNLVVEVCMDKYVTASDYSPTHAIVNQTTTSYVSTANYHTDAATLACPTASGATTYSQRPNIKFLSKIDGCASSKVPATVTVANVPALDISATQITSPTGNNVSTTSPYDVKIKFRNYGSTTLTTAKINWTLNGLLMPQYNWSGNLTSGQTSSEITIGNTMFTTGINKIIVWTSQPNGAVDMYQANDSIQKVYLGCMSGQFTIGIGKDFPTFNTALTAMDSAGVCGNVVFVVDSGVYNERLTITPKTGIGPNATVTFTSATGDSTDVVLLYPTSTAAAWAMKFNNASYYKFNKMTLSVAGGSSFSRIMELAGTTNNIEISNCVIEGIQSSSTSNNFALIYANGASISNNVFKNNRMLNGSMAFYLYGTSAGLQKKNIVSNNIIKDFYYQAIYLYYQDSILVHANDIQNLSTAATVYGIYSYYSHNHIYTKNRIHITGSSAYCMYLYSSNSVGGTALVANNFITQSVGTGVVYGIYNSTCTNLNVYNNSVNITAGGTGYYAYYITGGTNVNIANNIFSNTGGGYAYYASSTTGVNISNYNNLYATGTNIGYWGSAQTTFNAFKTASGKEQNSVNVNPGFFGLTDLHLVNFYLDKKAIPSPFVIDDIDGNLRDTLLPDIGADEFVLPDNDAGVLSVITPVSPVNAGSQPVKVSIRNFGQLNLGSVLIKWSVNGINQPAFGWTGNIISSGIDTVTIGNYNFPAGQSCLKIWTSMPNNTNDQLTINDTITNCVVTCSGALSGAYSVGSTNSDYPTISGAIQALQLCGISGPVVFNIAPGNYVGQYVIPNIATASTTNTITFKSANNDSSSVVLNFNATSTANNYIFKLDGAKFITIKNLKLNPTSTSFGNAIVLTNSAKNNVIEGNYLQAATGTAGTINLELALIRVPDANSSPINIRGNRIQGGSDGIYFLGTSAVKMSGIEIRKNTIIDFGANGIEAFYPQSIVVDSNTITSSITNTAGLRNGIKFNYPTDSIKVTRNKISITSNSFNANGFYIGTTATSATAMGLIANNMISITNGSNFTYGLRFDPASYLKIYNNSINIWGTSTTDTRGINIVNGAGNILKNNNVVCNISPLFIENATAVSASDYNNFYTTNTTNAYRWGTVSYATLDALKAVSLKDSNSVSYAPDFISNTDLHVYTSALNNIGTVIPEITDDIDGQLRNTTTPDIGADEYTPLPIDLGATSFIEPTSTYSQSGYNVNIKVKFKNFGADSVSNFNIVFKIGNAAPVIQPYTNYLLSNTTDSASYVMTVPVSKTEIKVYTSLASDGNYNNDTIKMNFFGVPVKSIPYTENFDSNNEEWFQADGFTSQWQKGTPNASVINSAYSAPNAWTTVLSGNYVNSSNDILYTPIFNNNTFKADTLKFWFRTDSELNKDGGYIEYKDVLNNWLRLGTIAPDTNGTNWYNGTSPMWTGTGLGWQQAKYKVSNISNLPQMIQFRFVFNSDGTNNNYNGWAIDNFELTLLPIATDAGVISITDPITSKLGDTVYPTITIKNFGLNTLTTIPVKYSVNGQLIANEIFNTSLAPGAIANYTFTTYFKVLNQPTYTLASFTAIPTDYYNGADSTVKIINVSPALKDVGIAAIITPTDIVSSGSVVSVTVKIKNYGTTPQTSIPVSYQRGTQPVQNATWSGSALNLGDSVLFTFPTTFTAPLGSSFSFSAYTSLSDDAYPMNNKITKTVTLTNLPANAGNITSTGAYGGDTICIPISSTTPVVVNYSVPTIVNVTKYVWNYTGSNVTYTDTTTSANVSLTFSPNATDGNLTVYAFNSNGNGGLSPVFAIDVIQNCTIGIDEEVNEDNFLLSQNMPNPAYDNAIIEFNLPQSGEIRFEIVNIFGQSIYSFVETKTSGKHILNLNTRDLSGSIYYYSLTFKGKRLVKKMVVNK